MTYKQGYLALVAVLAAAAAARAQTEVRDFDVLVGGKTAGQYRITITRQQDGAEVAQGAAAVRVDRLVGAYTYSIRTSELWMGSRLQKLTVSGEENGKKFEVTAAAEQDDLRVRVNGKERFARADCWTTTYWKLLKAQSGAVSLLDCDTGETVAGALKYVGPERVTVAGQPTDCRHYKVEGVSPPVDVWYDAQGRLVRQEFAEDGHHTVFQLSAVRR